MEQIEVTGMILSETPMGENDRRVVILTKEKGKISAFARGARRPTNQLVGMTGPFSFGTFWLYEGRTSYTLQRADIDNYFHELRSDVVGAYYGFYFLEIANYYTREANDEVEMLKLLYVALRALVNPHIPNQLIRCIFELKSICINGEGPQVFQCVQCQKDMKACAPESVVFSPAGGGLVCRDCQGNVGDPIPLEPSTIYTLQFIVTSKIEKLYTFTVSENVLQDLKKIMKRYMLLHVDWTFHSLDILQQLEDTADGDRPQTIS